MFAQLVLSGSSSPSEEMESTTRMTTGLFASTVIVMVIVTAALGLGSPTSSHSTITTSSVSLPDGIQLNLTLNSTSLLVGQKLHVTISIFNTLPQTNVIRTANDRHKYASNFQFLGVPVALWAPCFYDLPTQMVVLKGDYDLSGLQATANVPFYYMCMEAVNVDHVIFQPTSDQASLTGIYDVDSSNQTLGPFTLAQNFTTGGYWNLQSLAGELNIPIIGSGANPNTPPDSTPFVPGQYTVAAADEWGQVAILHFSVH